MYTGSVPEIMKRFGASQELCLAGLTFYLLGLAFGPALSGPLSEVFGRKPLYMFSLPIAMLFTMGVGLAKNIETILVLRFFCGFFSSPALAVASGTISDCWAINPAEQSFAVALFCLCPFLGPVLGPIIGGFAGEYKGWQWASAWVLLMFFGAVWPFTIILPETYKPIILARKAQKRGMKVEVPKLNIAFVKKVIKFNLFMPLKLLIEEPIVLVLSVVHHMDLEKKLLNGKIGAPFLPIALFWLGWSGRSDSIHWMAPTASGVFFGYGLILVFFSVVSYFSMSFPPIYVASAIAANNLLRYTLASVFPLFTVQCFENLGIGWAGSLFAFIALAMVPVPYVFGYFGPHLRARSKFGYAAYFKKLEEQKELQAAADAKKKNTNRTQEQSVNSSAVELEMSSESEKAVAEKV
ncbi:Major Facilitator Superfamily protein [Candida albicans]|uniref:Major Facilitator Superfamily protein n=1 Tax=Candida albicans TaxID=5476 RepID=A0A8H6C668_CANAX|nr:Major Facilitator Superfamily protein [Candida albicans]